MPTRHSKSAQIREFVTQAERSRLTDMGTQSARLGADSMRSYDSCCLCLQFAIMPMVTPAGYLYCKECIFDNIVEQKKAYQRHSKKWEQEQAASQAKESSLSQMKTNVLSEVFAEQHQSILPSDQEVHARRFEFKQQAIHKIETAGTEGPSTQNYWIPSNTPSYIPTKMEAPPENKLVDPMDKECNIKIKQLVQCHFTEQRELQAVRATSGEGATKANINEGKYQCPSCCRTLHNGVRLPVLSTCGHVVCSACVDKFAKNEDDNDETNRAHVAKKMKSDSLSTSSSSSSSSSSASNFSKNSYSCIVCAEVCQKKQIIQMKAAGTGFCAGIENPASQIAKHFTPAMGMGACSDHTNNPNVSRVVFRV